MKKRRKNRRNQRGVALLFALGILSLLLIMGLAFVANSLLAQKIANNNSSRSQAKMLAQSAISRMAISMMYYQYGAANPDASEARPSFIPLNYMDVRSHYDIVKSGQSEPDTNDREAVDGLRNADSKLIPGIWLTNYDLAKDLRGEWSYITARDSSGDDKIIGRIAYQLIPTTTSAQINLDHSLSGVYSQGDPTRIPWQIRIGTGINELNLDETTVFKNWEGSYAPANKDDMNAATFDAFFNAYKDTLFATDKDKKEAWVRHWFADGTVAADPEYYRYDSGSKQSRFYHRFNLGKLDPAAGTITDAWYDRFDGLSANDKNSKEAVDKLAHDSIEFKITDKWTPAGVGLPFLKYIADTKGTFGSLTDRRRQIAANLNDYCDEDSIPTSNVDAKTWMDKLDSTAPDSDWPLYTGNEKTPYINEFAFGFKVTPKRVAGKTGTSIENSRAAVSLTLDQVELIAELINIYKTLPNLKDYKLAAYLRDFEVYFKATAKVRVSYIPSGGTDPVDDPTPKELDPLQMSVAFKCDPQKVELSFKDSDSVWKDGYLVDAVNLQLKDMSGESGFSAKQTFDFDFTDKCGNVIPSGSSLTKVEVVNIKLEVVNPKFTMGGITLIDVSDTSATPVEFGVDFVRWPNVKLPADTSQVLFKKANVSKNDDFKDATALDSIGDRYKYFYLGGMQARDPRQNLNVIDTATVEKDSDWTLLSEIGLADFDNRELASGKKRLTVSIPYYDDPDAVVTDENKVQSRLAHGEVNLNGVPKKETGAGVFDPDYDAETALDPAWRESSKLGTGESNLSTAFIRNAPMKSLWELGAIHRGAAWETINLKSAMKPGSTAAPVSNSDMRQAGDGDASWENPGTFYVGGDGGILEQVKLADGAYCYGKLNVNMLSNNLTLNPNYTAADDEMGRALFFKIRRGQLLEDLDDFASTNGTLIDWTNTQVVVSPLRQAVDQFRLKYTTYDNAFENRAQFLAWKDASAKCLANGFGIIPDVDYEKLPDAQREELVGKTINLLKGSNSVSNMIRFIVVAQTVRDHKGTIARLQYDGTVATETCSYGIFDVKQDSSAFPDGFPANDKFVYFDEITGEVKLLVTMENNPNSGQTIIRQIEYID
ncbi:MAG: hypothetical protein HPZ91_01855 [Lentisphaeria bacterium]|nr:hypothetical protein [Lentisphaeria bacterium]